MRSNAERNAQGTKLPVIEVNRQIDNAGLKVEPKLSEEQAQKQIEEGVDTLERCGLALGQRPFTPTAMIPAQIV